MNKRMCLTALLWMAISMAFAQNKFTGKVIDAATNQPLQGVTVRDLQKKITSISDQNGNFSLPEETDSIRVSSIGYYTFNDAVKEQKIVISLSPSFANLNEVVVSGNREVQKRT
jgi:hypothetical protein